MGNVGNRPQIGNIARPSCSEASSYIKNCRGLPDLANTQVGFSLFVEVSVRGTQPRTVLYSYVTVMCTRSLVLWKVLVLYCTVGGRCDRTVRVRVPQGLKIADCNRSPR